MNRSIYLRMWMVLLGISSLAWAARLASGAQEAPPFFPIGLSAVDPTPAHPTDVTQEFPDIAAAGFNLIQSYQFEVKHDDVSKNDQVEFLDAAHRHGLKVLMGIPNECVCSRDWSAPTITIKDRCIQDLRCIQERVSALKDHPALFGWVLYDEPDIYKIPPKDLERAYKTIKETGSLHPVSIGTGSPVHEILPYVHAFDMSTPQWLLVPLGYTLAEHKEPFITEIETLTSLRPPKSFIHHVYIYNLANDHLMCKPNDPEPPPICTEARYPTKNEMRFLAYYAIIHGSTGLSFNCYRFDYRDGSPGDDISRRANPSQWAAVSSVSRELKAMTPILLAQTQDLERAGVTMTEEAPVEAMIKQHQGKTYLLTVNPSTDTVQLQVRLARNRFPNPHITLLPQRQRLSLQSGAFEAQWSPYEVRIYEIARGGS